jgi:hypothetical protein
MNSRFVCGLTSVCLLFAAPLAAQSEAPDSLARGRQLTTWFVEGQSDSLWAAMGETFRQRVGDIESIENMMDQIYNQAGDEVEVVSETAHLRDDGVLEYRRVSEFDASDENIVWIWRTNDVGEIVGAGIRPESPAPPAAN